MIWAGVVLLGQVVIHDRDVWHLSDTALGREYGWLTDAPNIQMRRDDWDDCTVIRAKVPVITSLRTPRR